MNVQPILESEQVILKPLHEDDFESLYRVASDPKIWEQHPNQDRWKKEVFQNFFTGALDLGGAFLILNKKTSKPIGSTRFYDYSSEDNSIFIGYTFYGTDSWGTGINAEVKKLMLEYIFQFVDLVKFHVGNQNRRSQIAMERLGAMAHKEIDVAYYGEPTRTNIEYWIPKADFLK